MFHLSVSESGGYLPPLWLITVKYLLVIKMGGADWPDHVRVLGHEVSVQPFQDREEKIFISRAPWTQMYMYEWLSVHCSLGQADNMLR